MSKNGSSRKSLIIGIVAAVVILAVLLVLLLTQCIGNGEGANSETVQTTAPVDEVPTYDLYWNVDRAQYDGKSEAGMSGRNPESDGYFHVRFFKDGEMLDLKVSDRKTVNAIEVNDVMGLVFDEEGIVIGVTSIDDMPLEQVGWQFYVQSVGGKVMKLNSSKAFNGLEVMLDIHDFTGIWDMTGLEGEVGMEITPISGDRVIAIANLAGELTHVYVYERPEFMQTFEAECIHCKKTVEWKMWNKENALPSRTGHYQLQNNISGMAKQQYIEEDQKVCLDLNGMRVDGKQDARVYTMHYSGAQLAIMDTSEGQKGVLKGHSTKSDQGGVVWVRYGQFHLYSGTLDGSDMISKLNGTAVDVNKGTYFYMHGGRIIGGNAKAVQNAKGNWTNGVGGAVTVRGKFVMNDGIIQGGKATGAVTKRDANGQPSAYSRGFGGNVYVASGAEFEMNGGTIKNGTATYAGANVYVDGTGNFTMNDGVIIGGKLTGKGRNGGNVFVSGKSTMTMNGGSILNGACYNCGANMYLNGKFVMNGGVIAGGKVYKWGTKTINKTEDRTNVFSVQGDFYMYGGRIAGGFQAVDTVLDKNPTIVLLSGYATIVADEGSQYNDMTLSLGGNGVTVYVGTLYDSARIGVNTSMGIFTLPTKESNVDNFFSNVDDAEICYVDGCIGLGRFGCLCGNNDKGEHFGKCDGTQLFWAPMTSTTLPTTTGNYYLPRVKDAKGNLQPRTIVAKTQASMVADADIAIDLNGGTIEGAKNYRIYSLHNLGTHLAITDSSEAKTGTLKPMGQGSSQGNAVWTRYGEFDFYAGTLDGSGYTLHPNWNVGDDKIPGTKDDKSEGRDGGTLAMGSGTVMNMYGGTVIGNKMQALTLTKTYKETVTETQIVDGKETEVETTVTKEVTRDVPTSQGASLIVTKNCVFNMYAGTIKGGTTQGYGGNVYISSTGTMNVYDGTITEGVAGPTNDKGDKAGWGGNICIADSGTLNIDGENVVISDGLAGGNGGNIYIRSSSATLNLKQGTISGGESVKDQGGNIFSSGNMNLLGGLVTGGKAANGGNIGINSGGEGLLDGVVIENGKVPGVGGNIRINSTNKKGQTTITGKTLITGGEANQGGNIALNASNYKTTDSVAIMNITGGTIEKGFAKADGGNIYITNSDTCTTTLTVTGGTIDGGQAMANGGNIVIGEKASVVLNGGTVQNGLAGKGGKVEGATENGWGGNIRSYGYLEISGATVSAGTAGGNGGSIYIDAKGELLMTSGTVTGGKTTADQGGNIFCGGKMQLLGGTVTLGRVEVAKNGGNIAINSSKEIVLKNVTVSDGYSKGTGGNIGISSTAGNATITIGEGTVITGGTAATNGGNLFISPNNYNKNNPNLYVNITGATIENGTATGEGGNICIAASGTGDSQLTITDTTITGGSAKNGGSIALASGAEAVMNSVTVKGGIATGGSGGNVYVPAGATLQIGGTSVIEDGQAIRTGVRLNSGKTSLTGDGGNGGNICSAGTLTVDGAEVIIRNGKAWGKDPTTGEVVYRTTYQGKTGNLGWGGNVYVNGGTASITDATITGGISGGNGGGVYASVGINLTDAKISGNQTMHDNGGNVFLSGTVTHNITGCEITGGKANNGGNISINSTGGTINITDCEITDGKANSQGGNLRVFNAAANLNLTGVTISGGTCSEANKAHANLNVATASTVVLENTTIDGYASIAAAAADITLKGKVTITGGELNLTLGGAMLKLVDFSEESMVNINYAKGGVFTTTTQESFKDNFASDDPNLFVDFVDGKMVLALGKYNCLCGRNAAPHDLGCDGTTHFWLPWNSSNSMPLETGYWYLTQDTVTLDVQQYIMTPNQNIVLDLNGKQVVSKGNPRFFVASVNADNKRDATGASITVTDTVGGGTMKTTAVYDQGCIAWLAAPKSSFTLIKGTIDASGLTYRLKDGAPNNSFGGNAIIAAAANSSINIYGGTIKGGVSPYGGSAVAGSAWNSTVNIYGGTIEGNAAEPYSTVRALGAINISGGTITGGVEICNSANDEAGNGGTAKLTLSGAPAIDELLLTDLSYDRTSYGKILKLPVIKVDGKLTNATPIKLAVYEDMDCIFTEKTDAANASKFVPTAAGQNVLAVEEGADAGKLYIGKTRCVCGATDGNHVSYTDSEGNTVGCDGQPKPFMPWTTTNRLPTTTGYYYLTADVNYDDQSKLVEDAKVVLDLNGKTVKPAQTDGKDINTRCYALYDLNNELTIADSVGTGTMIASAVRSDQGNVVWVRYNEADAEHLPMHKPEEAGTFVLLGGTLKGASSGNAGNGEVVNVNSYGKFYMLGGTIEGGTAKNGGNVYVSSNAKMYMTAGTIKGGKSVGGDGGNLYLSANATCLITGTAVIEDGHAVRNGVKLNGAESSVIGDGGNGGNIYSKGTLTIDGKDVKIKNGDAYGLHPETGDKIYTITIKNSAGTNRIGRQGWGGNIVSSGTLVIKDATIEGGTSGGNGGSVYSSSTTTLEGVTITGGVSMHNNGGNVFLSGAVTHTITDCEITDGEADTGGNISINSGGTINISDTEISGGEAATQGGNLRLFNVAPNLNLTNVTITGGICEKVPATANLDIHKIAAKVKMIDTQIAGGASMSNASATLTLTGETSITGGDVNLTFDGVITPSNLAEDAVIGLTHTAGAFTGAVDQALVKNFVSDSKDFYVGYLDGKLQMIAVGDATLHCVCGSTTTTHQQGCDGTVYQWTEWTDELAKAHNGGDYTSTTSLPSKSGYYYLAKNAELTLHTTIGTADQQVYLDLNGKTVSPASGKNIRLYRVNAASTLTITDVAGGGAMVNGATYTQGMIVWLSKVNARFDLFNATLDTTDAKYSFKDNGDPSNPFATSAVCVAYGGDVFNMYSGTILGGDSPNGGGAISVTSDAAEANIYGGTVKAHKDENRCAIYSLGAICVNGGTVIGGLEFNDYIDGSASGISFSGSPKVDFIKMTDENYANGTPVEAPRLMPITINGQLKLEKAIPLFVNISGIESGIVVKPGTDVTLDETALEWFSGQTHAIVLKDGNLELVSGENVYCVCGSSTEEHADGCDGTHYIWTALPTTYKGNNLATGNYYLTAPVALTDNQMTFPADSVVRINLNGYTITRKNARAISLNGSTGTELTITDTYTVPTDNTDTTRTGGKILLTNDGTYWYTGQGMGVWVTSNTTANWIKGTLDASAAQTTNTSGGTAFCVDNGSTLNIYGGNISGGKLKLAKAADVNGATINTNGKLYIGKATIIGGRTDGGKGGAIYVNASGNAELNGGTVSGGQAYTAKYNDSSRYGNGGAVFVNKGTFTLTSGIIENGVTGGQGGNIYVDGASGKLFINGGTIQGGQSGSYGGNIHVRYGTIIMKDGIVKNGRKGTSDNWDTYANIGFAEATASMTMTGGVVDGNIACVNNAGAVMTISGDAKITNTYNDLAAGTMTIKIGDLTDNAEIYLFHTAGSYSLLAADNYTLTEQDMSRIEPGLTYFNLTLDTANNKIDVVPAT